MTDIGGGLMESANKLEDTAAVNACRLTCRGDHGKNTSRARTATTRDGKLGQSEIAAA